MINQEQNPFTNLPRSNEAAPVVAPTADAGMVRNAMAPAPTVSATPTAGGVAQVDANQFSGTPASRATAGTAVGTGYDASKATSNAWDVADNQTVQGQVKSILAADSPLLQQARTRATEVAAGRGLINSSMAVQAGEGAVLDKALQIATPDAATFANAGRRNADSLDSTSQFNTGADNSARQFTSAAGNQASLANAGAATDVSRANAAAENTLQSQKIDVSAKLQAGNAQAVNDATKFDSNAGLQAQIANQEIAFKQSSQQYDAAVKMTMGNLDAAGKLQLQQIDASTRTQLAQIEERYKVAMQTSNSMTGTYQSMVDNITKIMADPDLTMESKQKSIDNITKLYNGALEVQEKLSGLDLGELLKGGDLAAPDGAPATEAPAPVYTETRDPRDPNAWDGLT